jgi:RNA polymerase sigma-70 factor (ECF subfamily)
MTRGAGSEFPSTLWTQVLAAGDPGDPAHLRVLDRLARRYWRPVFAYVRTAWGRSVEDAQDLTQDFFARILERGFLARARPERGSFRGFLKRSLRNYLVDRERAAAARRPDRPVFSLDAAPGELERLGPASPDETPDDAYDRQWVKGLLDEALGRLRSILEQTGKTRHYAVFEAYCLTEPSPGAPPLTYADVARTTGLSESAVRHALEESRLMLRSVLKERIRDYATDDVEAEAEVEDLLGR